MNNRMIINILGHVLRLEATFMSLPFIIGLIYGEKASWCFLVTALGLLLVSVPAFFFSPKGSCLLGKGGTAKP